MVFFQKLYLECDEDLRFDAELQKIFGIGVNNQLYKKYGFKKQTKFGAVFLRPSLEYHIESYILKNFKVSYPLKQEIRDNIRKKIVIKTYEGLRHKLGLPVRGQRTHTNHKTMRRHHIKELGIVPKKVVYKKNKKKNRGQK
jgi:small subunit ribosomal protein S13